MIVALWAVIVISPGIPIRYGVSHATRSFSDLAACRTFVEQERPRLAAFIRNKIGGARLIKVEGICIAPGQPV